MDKLKLTCLKCAQLNAVPKDKLYSGPICAACKAPLMGAQVSEISPDVFKKASKNDDVPLVVDFWAPWCGPCRAMAPEFAKTAKKMKGNARFAKLNTEEHQKVSQGLGIRGIPTMIKYRGGRELARQAGAMSADQIEKWVSRQK